MAKSFNDLPTPAQAAILGGLAVVLVGGAFYYGIPGVVDSIYGLSGKRDQLQAEVNKLKAENQKNQAVERERTELLNRIAQLEKQLATLRTIVPDEQAADEFARMVYSTATGAGIFVRTFVAQPLVTRDFHIEMPFSMRTDGTYYALAEYFNRLARQQRIVSVTGLSLGPPEGGGMGSYSIAPHETVGANCTIVTYFNRPQPPPGRPAQRQQQKR